jgi:protein-S-isoprenylcysteine O-methyltransferase Ste14
LGSPLLISANWLVGGLSIAMTGLDIASRIRTEEAMMLDWFRERYRSYMARADRLVPRLAKRRQT